MAYIDVDIEDYLDEVSTENLRRELNKRAVESVEDVTILRKIFKVDSPRGDIVLESLIEKLNKIPLQDLETFLDKY